MMDKFEKQFEQLDVQTQVMDESMNASTTLSVPTVSELNYFSHCSIFWPYYVFSPPPQTLGNPESCFLPQFLRVGLQCSHNAENFVFCLSKYIVKKCLIING